MDNVSWSINNQDVKVQSGSIRSSTATKTEESSFHNYTDNTTSNGCNNEQSEDSKAGIKEIFSSSVDPNTETRYVISDKTRQTIRNIVEQIEGFTELEKYLLHLKLTEVFHVADPLRQPLNPLGSRSEIYRTISWIKTHLEEDADISLPKRHVYDAYFKFCTEFKIKALSQADFGKVMKQVYPNVRARRLGTRGNSRYCYSGLRERITLKPPILPDLADKPLSSEDPCPKSNLVAAAWIIIKEWSEQHFGIQFPNIQALAYYLITNHSIGCGTDAADKVTTDLSSTTNGAVEGKPKLGNASKINREMQVQLQRKIQLKHDQKVERKRKVHSPRNEPKSNSDILVSCKRIKTQAKEGITTPISDQEQSEAANNDITTKSNISSAANSAIEPISICDSKLEKGIPTLPNFKFFQRRSSSTNTFRNPSDTDRNINHENLTTYDKTDCGNQANSNNHESVCVEKVAISRQSTANSGYLPRKLNNLKCKLIQPKLIAQQSLCNKETAAFEISNVIENTNETSTHMQRFHSFSANRNAVPLFTSKPSINSGNIAIKRETAALQQNIAALMASLNCKIEQDIQADDKRPDCNDDHNDDDTPTFPITRERLNSVSSVDKDAMDEYLGNNNSQHEEELSQYFKNNTADPESLDNLTTRSNCNSLSSVTSLSAPSTASGTPVPINHIKLSQLKYILEQDTGSNEMNSNLSFPVDTEDEYITKEKPANILTSCFDKFTNCGIGIVNSFGYLSNNAPSQSATCDPAILKSNARRRVSFGATCSSLTTPNTSSMDSDTISIVCGSSHAASSGSSSIPPSPNTRRKHFAFCPISPSDSASTNPSKSSSATGSPLASPRNTPMICKTYHQSKMAGATQLFTLPLRNITQAPSKPQTDLCDIVITSKHDLVNSDIAPPNCIAADATVCDSTIVITGESLYTSAMSAPPSPMIHQKRSFTASKSVLKDLLNASKKVSYTPNYTRADEKFDHPINVLQDSKILDPALQSFRSQSVPLLNLVDQNAHIEHVDDFNDDDLDSTDDEIHTSRNTVVNKIINSLDSSPQTSKQPMKLLLPISPSEVSSSKADTSVGVRYLYRSQSFDTPKSNAVFEYKLETADDDGNITRQLAMNSITSRSVPSTPLPFMRMHTDANRASQYDTTLANISNSRSYPSTPSLLANENMIFKYNINGRDCLLNGTPVVHVESDRTTNFSFDLASNSLADNPITVAENNVNNVPSDNQAVLMHSSEVDLMTVNDPPFDLVMDSGDISLIDTHSCVLLEGDNNNFSELI